MSEPRDFWYEAREHTRKLQPPLTDRVKGVIQSLPGMPTREVMTSLSVGRGEDAAIVADLNKYRPGVNLKALQDRGVNRFILRMGGPTQWVEGDWRYQEDATWRPYMTELDRLGVDIAHQVIGYHVLNTFEDYNLVGDLDVHINLINQWTGNGFMPGAFVTDHEVSTCWRGATKITQPGGKLVDSLKAVTLKIWQKWHKMSGIYSARWFIDQNNPSGHQIFLDGINKPVSLGGEGVQRPMWYAWVPQPTLGNTVYNDVWDLADKLLIPTGDQINRFLQCGSYSLYELWQFLFAFKTPDMLAAGQTGIDISISRGTLAEFDAAFGLTGTVEPPPPPPDPTAVTRAEFDKLASDFANHTHVTWKPV